MKLHLAVNSGFIQKFSEIAKNIDSDNEHFFIVYGEQMTGQIIDKKSLHKNFVIVEKLTETSNLVDSFINQVSTIHIHFLSNEVINFLNNFNIVNKKLIWYFWGADVFSLPEIYTKIKQYRTDNFKAFLGRCKQIIKPTVTGKKKLDFIKKIDFIAHYSIDDYSLLQPLLKKEASLKYFTYGVIDFVIDYDTKVVGRDILLGNSASQNNHHLYAIKKFLPKGINRTIYCPLSYGGNTLYTTKIIDAGKKKFGNLFIPLTNLIDTKIYHSEILSQAEFAVMPHNRSQAWGNIMQLLWQGCKVFMLPTNNLYKFLKEKGFQVFELTEFSLLDLNKYQVDVEYNRQLLQEHFAMKSLNKYYKDILAI